MLNVPDFNLQMIDLATLVSAMVSFLALMWGAKKLLFMLEISDFAIGLQIKKDERKARELRQRKKLKSSFLKVSQTKQQKDRRKQLYKTKQLRVLTQEQRRLRDANTARNKFNNRKRAFEMRENELIKEAKRAELNSKINSRISVKK